MVAALAGEYHWPPDYIYYELPLTRAIQYLHCLQMGNPMVWTIQREKELAASAPVELAEDVLAAILAADDDIDLTD